MRCIAVICISLLMSFPATAAPFVVQSGEHIGFTRLVTQVPTQDGWKVEQSGNKVTLQIDAYEGGFDTSRVFDLIPRGRVQRVEASDNKLAVYLGCDCTISAFNVSGGYVALDIISSPEKPKQASVRPPIPPYFEPVIVDNVRSIQTPKPEYQTPSRGLASADERAALADTQQRLSLELGRAITKGLLNATGRRTPPRAQIDVSTLEDDIPTPVIRSQLGDSASNIRISSSMDESKRIDPSKPVLSDEGVWCPPDDATDVAAWGDNRPFNEQIGEARIGLFGEFDKLNPVAALTLAKRYLYFGFGAEARQILAMVPNLSDKDQMLLSIAGIVDATGAKTDLSTHSYAVCDGNISLWTFLAGTVNANAAPTPPRHLLLALNALPVHLRQHLTPIISNRFLALGDTDSATTVLRSLVRLPDGAPVAAKLAEANVGIETGETEEGTKKLLEIATTNSQYSPQALINLVGTKIKNGQAIAPETVELIEAYEQELGDSELGPDLQKALILALIEMQEFDHALRKIDDLRKAEQKETISEVMNHLASKLARTSSDITFLETVLAQPDRELEQLKDEAKLSIASRLLQLGFAGDASKLVKSISDRVGNSERQLLAAQVSLALGQPYQAQADLLGLSTEAANLLRARAKSMLGAHDEAFSLYQDTDEKDAALRSAWLAENWRDLTSPENAVFGPIATLDVSLAGSSSDQIGMLGRTASALAESSNARSTLRDFLIASEIGANLQ